MVEQLYKVVTTEERVILGHYFVNSHRLRPGFDYHFYFVNSIQDDFVTVLGMNWYLWLIVMLEVLFAPFLEEFLYIILAVTILLNVLINAHLRYIMDHEILPYYWTVEDGKKHEVLVG